MLIKRKSGTANRSKLQALGAGLASGAMDRRTFLRRSGLTVGGLAAVGAIPLGTVRKAAAAGSMVSGAEIRKNICTHCSVGCTVTAEVQNGVNEDIDRALPFVRQGIPAVYLNGRWLPRWRLEGADVLDRLITAAEGQ